MNSVSSVSDRLTRLGLQLPAPPRPAGQYLTTVQSCSTIYVSAQLPYVSGHLKYTGQVGGELTIAQGRDAAAVAALNVLSQLDAALGSIERLKLLLFVEGHVASAPGFERQPEVLDGASELFNSVLAQKAGHARAVFSPRRLPLNSPVILVVTAEIAA